MKIICFGDSLTRGVSFVKGRVRIIKDNYPAFLEKLFSVNNPEDTIVLNKGVFNDNSDLLIKRLEKDVLSEKPNYVLLNVGGNDCNFKWQEVAENPDKNHDPIVPISQYIENIGQMVTKMKQSNITPILLTLPPLDPVRYYKFIADRYGTTISHWISCCGGIEHWHSLYNLHLNKLIDQLNLPSIDVRSALNKAGDVSDFISDDGIHLNSEGYKKMSAFIFEEMLRLTGGQKEQLS
ncbi:SGNH/GDSL hydrolase family protein [Cytobacillus oceanisediminis]|jgi:lysophospholipase L1-like esterase|uniref:SGNH/GDSL hydrolase family protein n=2 Tax=Niallia TaxID=2837506 RepID=A0A941JFK5_NIACI|nr:MULTISPECIES: GDSL-type esterase/lipase family protein [Bacillaceae]EOR22843.1 G-D-S-L family lipolytic protein [Niallia nealsonii AAU1]MBQ6446190.1 SGNH/GDSL hydrolase family protein [Bacillus sp. (in: firmicutes)]MDU1843930.1 GDSL-type esterase/lipase family protein [Niallia nealsonii]MBZ9535125.1 SGNH/GDSL hydrolase family protein [Cytobacillus oceanisediminis]MCB5237972.1 GDSL-type esterase/lipase family protein [Niallia circulans]